ncbi:hypothetical protein K504DRAFT_489124 [Pleomassaria siparia CBS 279.74]|uniref:Uncharacterized protein n=1 Tax=Pleomassaria siparia CBS 279.74 TaxID=1314801 RepID=A0A6G1KK77_9PLEO|nr:hypothetical protein K504DRAFT_489124 [Pleomassaria siparia CBS 279.74]
MMHGQVGEGALLLPGIIPIFKRQTDAKSFPLFGRKAVTTKGRGRPTCCSSDLYMAEACQLAQQEQQEQQQEQQQQQQQHKRNGLVNQSTDVWIGKNKPQDDDMCDDDVHIIRWQRSIL